LYRDDGETPLHFACRPDKDRDGNQMGDPLAVVQALVDAKADVNAKTE
jgi:hypothetical protein